MPTLSNAMASIEKHDRELASVFTVDPPRAEYVIVEPDLATNRVPDALNAIAVAPSSGIAVFTRVT